MPDRIHEGGIDIVTTVMLVEDNRVMRDALTSVVAQRPISGSSPPPPTQTKR